MAPLSVGQGQTYATIAAAVAASSAGDTITVQAGTYTNDWLQIGHDLNLVATGGWVRMVTENAQPPNGKAAITESGNVHITGFDISGVTVPDANGAAIRYEGGNLTLDNVFIHDNQEGLLGAPDATGSITIDHSEIARNGDGSGHTHGLYVGQISTFTLINSYVHDTNEGHEVKSRAASNIIQNNRIFDNNSTASYSIDLPNGGAATITGNVIQQGPNSHNPAIMAYGEEGLATGYSVGATVSGNTFINDQPGGYLLLNPGGYPFGFADGTVFGLTQGGTVLAARPPLDLASIQFLGSPPPSSPPPPVEQPPLPPATPPPTEIPPTSDPILTPLEQYHADVLADFMAWAAVNPKLSTKPQTLKVFSREMNSTSVLGILPGDHWSN